MPESLVPLPLLVHKPISALKQLLWKLDRFSLRGRYYHLLHSAQNKDARWLPEYQLKRLQDILLGASRHVPYYTALFKRLKLSINDFQRLEDLRKLPILTRNEVKRLGADHFLDKRYLKHPIEAFSSGTTGSAMCFYHSRQEGRLWEAFFQFCLDTYGLSGLRRQAVIRAKPFLHKPAGTPYVLDRASGILFLSSIAPDEQRLELYLNLLRKYSPDCVCGYPSIVHQMARLAMEKGISLGFSVFYSMSENLLSFQRSLISKVFSCRVCNYYSSEELRDLAIECPCGGLHVMGLNSILEIADAQGNIMEKEGKGRVIVSGLNNYLMPLIRYDTGDLGALSQEACPCTVPGPLLTSLEGRASETIRLNGKHIYPSALAVLLEEASGIKECRFNQVGDNQIEVHICPDRGYSAKDGEKLSAALREFIDPGLQVDIRLADSLPRSASGKFSFIAGGPQGQGEYA